MLKVNYNGGIIATVDSPGIKRLLTNGKVCKSDILLDYDYSWMGESAELVKAYPTETTKLSATAYNGWTPSTTAKAIVATSNLEQINVDMATYEYVIVWRFLAEPVYGSGAVNTARVVKCAQTMVQFCLRRPSNLTNIGTNTYNGNTYTTPLSYAVLDYWNSNSSHTVAWSASYGLYISAPTPAYASSTATSTKLTIKRPQMNARCSTTYFSTGNAGAVDQANTYLYLDCKVYRVKAGTCASFNAYKTVIDLYRGGF